MAVCCGLCTDSVSEHWVIVAVLESVPAFLVRLCVMLLQKMTSFRLTHTRVSACLLRRGVEVIFTGEAP